MRPSRRTLIERNTDLNARADKLAADLEEAEGEARACATALLCLGGELSRAKDVIASHIVAAGHPSTVLHDVHAFTTSLEQALADAGVDLRVELARLEGADL